MSFLLVFLYLNLDSGSLLINDVLDIAVVCISFLRFTYNTVETTTEPTTVGVHVVGYESELLGLPNCPVKLNCKMNLKCEDMAFACICCPYISDSLGLINISFCAYACSSSS
jgi:hypothetical protein